MTQSIGPPSLAQGTRIAVGFSTSISRFIPACGELSKPSWAIVQLDGSSPLARGTQDLDRLGYVADRFIPAYAGNSLDMCRSRCTFPVHPRLRGELKSSPESPGMYCGSSPLTRGTHISRYRTQGHQRFIPAYAGNSFPPLYLTERPPVHPRLRGELARGENKNLAAIGSSPLTRGTQIDHPDRILRTRFIPAYAGNSMNKWTMKPISSVHPRLRGELVWAPVVLVTFGGSSPLTRGTPKLRWIPVISFRFIPAYAGNSKLVNLAWSLGTVHPRLRGELNQRDNAISYRRRFIPAYAGNSEKNAPLGVA